jgi:hypothetical protein
VRISRRVFVTHVEENTLMTDVPTTSINVITAEEDIQAKTAVQLSAKPNHWKE